MSTWRSLAEKPMAALAEKYCAVTELSSPTPPSTTSHRHMRTMKPVSPEGMPRSMIAAIISGTISSKEASSSLNSGASTHSSRKSRM